MTDRYISIVLLKKEIILVPSYRPSLIVISNIILQDLFWFGARDLKDHGELEKIL